MSAKKADKKQSGTIRVRQIRSGIGCPREMRETLKALGLGKMHRVAERTELLALRENSAERPKSLELRAKSSRSIWN